MNPLALINGYRTILAGIGAIGFGIYQLTEGNTDKGVELIIAGLGAIGIGGKLDKVTDAFKSQTGPAPRG